MAQTGEGHHHRVHNIRHPLFPLATDMAAKAAEAHQPSLANDSSKPEPSLMTSESTHLLQGAHGYCNPEERLIEWARMSFKPDKSTSYSFTQLVWGNFSTAPLEMWWPSTYPSRSWRPGSAEGKYQHGILPPLLWPLLVYEVLITLVEINGEENEHKSSRSPIQERDCSTD